MKVNLVSESENQLLYRKDISFLIEHPGETTPKRSDIRDKITALLGASKDRVVVVSVKTRSGALKSTGVARLYDSVEKMKSAEPAYILKRNGIGVPEAPVEEKK